MKTIGLEPFLVTAMSTAMPSLKGLGTNQSWKYGKNTCHKTCSVLSIVVLFFFHRPEFQKLIQLRSSEPSTECWGPVSVWCCRETDPVTTFCKESAISWRSEWLKEMTGRDMLSVENDTCKLYCCATTNLITWDWSWEFITSKRHSSRNFEGLSCGTAS